MRFRNDHYEAVTLATDPPCTVLPGWTVETDEVHIAGLTLIDDDGEAITAVAGDDGDPAPAGTVPDSTADPALPLHRIHLEPPADWPVEQAEAPAADDAGPVVHQVDAAAPVAVQPTAGEPGTSPAGDAPAGDSE